MIFSGSMAVAEIQPWSCCIVLEKHPCCASLHELASKVYDRYVGTIREGAVYRVQAIGSMQVVDMRRMSCMHFVRMAHRGSCHLSLKFGALWYPNIRGMLLRVSENGRLPGKDFRTVHLHGRNISNNEAHTLPCT